MVALEPAVVAVARTGRAGASIRGEVTARISELESVARHLTRLATQETTGLGEALRLRDRVGAHEAARQKLADIDLATGLLG